MLSALDSKTQAPLMPIALACLTMTPVERLLAELDAQADQGKTAAGLAQAMGRNAATVSSWRSSPNAEIKGNNLIFACEYLGLSPAWVIKGKGPKHPLIPASETDLLPVASEDSETWTIPDYFNQAGAGGVSLIDEDMRAGSLEVSAQRLREKGLKVRDLGRLRALRVRGDSMEDYLYDGDTIVVLLRRDDGPEALMDGEKYVIRTPNDLKVKRLKSQIDGSLIVESINPRYPPETVTSPEELDIVGRVVFRQG